MFKRTHTCGELTRKHLGETVMLNGWVHAIRLHGLLVFVDLRDRYGKTQLTFNADISKENIERAKKLSMEDVISVKGIVRARAKEAVNLKLTTGEIEVEIHEMEILNESKPLPFLITDRKSALEDLRLKYRYLELRTEELLRFMEIRHKASQATRNYLSGQGFMEIETPMLMKSTPEGARDYLVPSRIHRGKFYALPQSPQTYKQLLMIAGYDRYFQIVRCFRDEDLRADRQPEFTQIDIEMSFVDEKDVQLAVESLVKHVFKEVIDVNLETPFPAISYDDAIETYGTDRPDIRFNLPLIDFSVYARESDFKAFKLEVGAEQPALPVPMESGIYRGKSRTEVEAEQRSRNLGVGDCVKAIVIENGSDYSRKVIDEFTDFVKEYSAQEGKISLGGLAWMRCRDGSLTGGISKFFSDELQKKIIQELDIKDGSLILAAGGKSHTVLPTMGALRTEIARRKEWLDENIFKPLWVTDFPLFEWDEKEDQWTFLHHPFTSPRSEDMELLESDPGAVRSKAYDLVINGFEVAGGSIRNHDPAIQMKILNLLGISETEAEEKFGFLLEALTYGSPPHGGIAFGYDRFVMILAGTHQIRDVIAFPKTTSALSLMDGSPSEVSKSQLDELGIQLKNKK